MKNGDGLAEGAEARALSKPALSAEGDMRVGPLWFALLALAGLPTLVLYCAFATTLLKGLPHFVAASPEAGGPWVRNWCVVLLLLTAALVVAVGGSLWGAFRGSNGGRLAQGL